jgi:ribosomal protein S18 acetylase RimI-like enzyme
MASLRRATVDDIDILLTLGEQFYRHFEYSFDIGKHIAILKRFLSHDGFGTAWLILANGSAVGYVMLTNGFSFEFGGVDAFVDELFVAPSHRSIGLGSRALTQLQQLAPSLGLVAIHLQTEHYNAGARRLYESSGFKDLKRSTQTWLVSDTPS